MARSLALTDITPYLNLARDAMRAYQQDSVFLENMFSDARKIKTKFLRTEIISELRTAETKARKACIASSVRVCYNVAPCGTSQCPFATGDLALLRIAHQPGEQSRPQKLISLFVDTTGYQVKSDVTIYQTENSHNKMVRSLDGTWRMYKSDTILNMQPNPLYQLMIDDGRLTLADDSPNTTTAKLNALAETYNLENAIEPLMKLRAA